MGEKKNMKKEKRGKGKGRKAKNKCKAERGVVQLTHAKKEGPTS